LWLWRKGADRERKVTIGGKGKKKNSGMNLRGGKERVTCTGGKSTAG